MLSLLLGHFVCLLAVLAPNDLNGCVSCPLGALCSAGTFKSLVAGAVWQQEGMQLRIVSCPAGCILVRFVLPRMLLMLSENVSRD